MKGNTLLSLLKFIIFIYLIVLLIKIVLPLLLLGISIYIIYRISSKKIKKSDNIEISKDDNENKKEEYKNYIINELFILSEKCNVLDINKKEEYLKKINELLNEFTERYDRIVESSYKSGIVLEYDNEEKIKMDFITRIAKLEEEINIEIEKETRKKDIHYESSKLQKNIGKKLNKFNTNQVRLTI